MAEQETRERDGAAEAADGSDTDEGSAGSGTQDSSGSDTGESSGSGGEGSSGSDTEDAGSDDAETRTTEAPARRSQGHAQPEELSEEDRQAQERSRSRFGRRHTDHDDEPRSSLDVTELIWKSATVLAQVVRVVTLVFAAVLVVQIGLSLAAVNPANGFARFIAGFSDAVVLGFRDLFLPADPTIMIVVNYGIAAVFWVLLGLFVAAALRWVGARIA